MERKNDSSSGAVASGVGEDGPWLSGEGCKERIRTKNITWPNHIFLEAPENKQPRVHPINFHLDNAAVDEMNRLWQEVKWKSEAPEYVEGTVIGVFETRSPIGRLVPEGWGNGYAGFGHLNRNPAQLVMKTIQEMRIEPRLPPTQQ